MWGAAGSVGVQGGLPAGSGVTCTPDGGEGPLKAEAASRLPNRLFPTLPQAKQTSALPTASALSDRQRSRTSSGSLASAGGAATGPAAARRLRQPPVGQYQSD